ncbi:MAG: polysaccharide deacetylase family protein [Actinomycetota bacterium]|nr:polysaccharide deacetylase family protein [Actinomycetota bacterium]MDP3630265.1 polysaccharide deacetylase family protein [Actinomycetota bacterium]
MEVSKRFPSRFWAKVLSWPAAACLATVVVGFSALAAGQVMHAAYITRWPTCEKVVVLTFDDGPDPVSTPRTLEILKSRDVPAMFFVSGNRSATIPRINYRAYDEHHIVASHSRSHRNMRGFSADQQIEELYLGEADVVKQLGGDLTGRVRYLRAPAGRISPLALLRIWQDGGVYVAWSSAYDKRTFFEVAPQAERVLKYVESIRPGDVILMHDGSPHAEQTLEDLPLIIDALRDRGYTFVTLDDLRKP